MCNAAQPQGKGCPVQRTGSVQPLCTLVSELCRQCDVTVDASESQTGGDRGGSVRCPWSFLS